MQKDSVKSYDEKKTLFQVRMFPKFLFKNI